MDVDTTTHEVKLAAQRREQDRNDYNNELNDVDVGRPSRFGIANAKQQQKLDDAKRKRALQQALLVSAEYQAAYQRVCDALERAEAAIYAAQVRAANALSRADEEFNNLLNQAMTLPDGTKVFLDDDGAFYNEHGQALSEDAIADIDWQENAPSWQQYLISKKQREQAKSVYDTTANHAKRLGEIRDEVENTGQLPTEERLAELEDELDGIVQYASPASNLQQGLEIERPTTPIVLDLKL